MKIAEIKEILGAELFCPDVIPDREVLSGCGSDLMSDVLAFAKESGVVLTGLVNAQVVRTAEMMDAVCVVFVRGKQPDEAILELAREKDITILTTDYPMFVACGKLYAKGLKGGVKADE